MSNGNFSTGQLFHVWRRFLHSQTQQPTGNLCWCGAGLSDAAPVRSCIRDAETHMGSKWALGSSSSKILALLSTDLAKHISCLWPWLRTKPPSTRTKSRFPGNCSITDRSPTYRKDRGKTLCSEAWFTCHQVKNIRDVHNLKRHRGVLKV